MLRQSSARWSLSRGELLAFLVQYDEGVHGAAGTGLDQSVAVDWGNVFLENNDPFIIELEYFDDVFHAVPEPNTQIAVDTDCKTRDNAFRHVSQRHTP